MRLETIPEFPGPGRDYFFMVPLLGKIREKFGKNSGRDGTTREKSWMVLKWTAIQEFFWNSVLNSYITYFSTQQEISHPVPNFGNFSQILPKFQIREFLFHFRDWDGTRKRMFPNVWDGKFPGFFREKIRFPGNGIRECRPLCKTDFSLTHLVRGRRV